MLEFSNKKDQDSVELVKIVSLLIHAAKIDENYTEKEKELIDNFIINFAKKNPGILKNKTSSQILMESEKREKDSNHILEFTSEIKKMDIKINNLFLETLCEIVLSDNKSGIYESNLIRRICGLLYISDKISGEIKLGVMSKKK